MSPARHPEGGRSHKVSGRVGSGDVYGGELALVGTEEDASPPLIEVRRLADSVSRMGDGAFDVTIQPVVDLLRGRLRREGDPVTKHLEVVATSGLGVV